MKALMVVVVLALAFAWSAAARASAPVTGRAPILHDKPDAGDDDEEDRG